MICLLDGPEQRDVQDKARALLKSRLTDMTAQKDELPPCPFCGNEPVLLTATEWDGFERYTEVRCDHCGISIDNEYKADAIAAWKHRTPTASPDSGRVEKLREALELIRAMLSQNSGSQSMLGDAFKVADRSEKRSSELQSLMRISYAVFCLKKKNNTYDMIVGRQ